jgi:L-amino acid N-acyltransferase YncA
MPTGSDRLIVDGSRIQEFLHARSRLPLQAEFRGVAREVNGTIVSAFGYDSFQDESCALHTCTDVPYTRDLLYKAFEIPFQQWNYRRLYAIIQNKNAKSLKLGRHLGFTEVGVTADLWFGVLEQKDCRWVAPTKRQQTCPAAAVHPHSLL